VIHNNQDDCEANNNEINCINVDEKNNIINEKYVARMNNKCVQNSINDFNVNDTVLI